MDISTVVLTLLALAATAGAVSLANAVGNAAAVVVYQPRHRL